MFSSHTKTKKILVASIVWLENCTECSFCNNLHDYCRGIPYLCTTSQNSILNLRTHYVCILYTKGKIQIKTTPKSWKNKRQVSSASLNIRNSWHRRVATKARGPAMTTSASEIRCVCVLGLKSCISSLTLWHTMTFLIHNFYFISNMKLWRLPDLMVFISFKTCQKVERV